MACVVLFYGEGYQRDLNSHEINTKSIQINLFERHLKGFFGGDICRTFISYIC